MEDNTMATTFTFQNPEGMDIFVRKWAPSGKAPKAAMVIAHGAAEHGQRYERLAQVLNTNGYAIYVPDHRGHGKTAGELEKAGWAGPDGWNGMLRDLKQLCDFVRKENPGLPLFLMGHSMGSFLTQRFIQLWGKELKGAILSGSAGKMPGQDEIIPVMEAMAEGEAASRPSEIFQATFDAYNQAFSPAKTGFEWLSRDEAEVQKYVDDPWCGFDFSNLLAADMLKGMADAWRPENETKIPTDLPIFIFSGALDPVGENTQSVKELVRRYEKLGIADMQVTFYSGGRHEMLNETNREEVQQDIVDWLENHMK